MRKDRAQDFARRLARRHRFRVGGEGWDALFPSFIEPAVDQCLPLAIAVAVRVRVPRHQPVPLGLDLLPSLDGFPEDLERFRGDVKLRVFRPAQVLFRQTDFLFAERGPVGFCRILLVRAAVRDMGVDVDERRPIRHRLRFANRLLNRVQVITRDLLDVPAVGLEAPVRVFGECQFCAPFDRDAIIVIKIDDVSEL